MNVQKAAALSMALVGLTLLVACESGNKDDMRIGVEAAAAPSPVDLERAMFFPEEFFAAQAALEGQPVGPAPRTF